MKKLAVKKYLLLLTLLGSIFFLNSCNNEDLSEAITTDPVTPPEVPSESIEKGNVYEGTLKATIDGVEHVFTTIVPRSFSGYYHIDAYKNPDFKGDYIRLQFFHDTTGPAGLTEFTYYNSETQKKYRSTAFEFSDYPPGFLGKFSATAYDGYFLENNMFKSNIDEITIKEEGVGKNETISLKIELLTSIIPNKEVNSNSFEIIINGKKITFDNVLCFVSPLQNIGGGMNRRFAFIATRNNNSEIFIFKAKSWRSEFQIDDLSAKKYIYIKDGKKYTGDLNLSAQKIYGSADYDAGKVLDSKSEIRASVNGVMTANDGSTITISDSWMEANSLFNKQNTPSQNKATLNIGGINKNYTELMFMETIKSAGTEVYTEDVIMYNPNDKTDFIEFFNYDRDNDGITYANHSKIGAFEIIFYDYYNGIILPNQKNSGGNISINPKAMSDQITKSSFTAKINGVQKSYDLYKIETGWYGSTMKVSYKCSDNSFPEVSFSLTRPNLGYNADNFYVDGYYLQTLEGSYYNISTYFSDNGSGGASKAVVKKYSTGQVLTFENIKFQYKHNINPPTDFQPMSKNKTKKK